MSRRSTNDLSQKTWPQMQFLYFLISACNLLAMAFCLYLSHIGLEIYQASVRENTIYDQHLAVAWDISNTAAEAQYQYASPLAANITNGKLMPFTSMSVAFRQKIERLRNDIAEREDKAISSQETSYADEMDAAIADILKLEGVASQSLDKAEDLAPGSATTKLLAQYSKLRSKSIDLVNLIAKAKQTANNSVSSNAASLKKYEFYIGILMVIVICSGAYYGQFMGRVLKRKFMELEKKNTQLAEAHEQALAFSREIQSVNHDMGTLNRQLGDNLAKLREAQDEALRKGKMAQLGNLTATVAHELRNPLSTVRTSTYLLARKIKDKGLGLEPQLTRINNGIVRCDNIITQLLDFSRSKPVKPEPTVLDVWLEKLIQAEAQKLPEIVAIECMFGLGDKLVEVEAGRLERAIINVLSNASEALVGKGDDPKARHSNNPVITITTRSTARGAEIIVSDNGPGISAENLKKVREPLFTTKNFGTGLGIPAVEQILEQHYGGLEIVSAEGQGATFTMWLPVHENQDEEAA